MAALIRGIPVTLITKTETGRDDFGLPVYSESSEIVNNVLVTPLSSDEVAQDYAWHGVRTIYELCLPKGDSHVWTNNAVEFFGQRYDAVGEPREYIEANLPLCWNRKIRVARHV